jgi:hypothetical protein
MSQAQPLSPSITVTPLACLITRTAYNALLDIRRAPPHPEPTVLDFIVSVQGLTAWVFAQYDLREHHPEHSCDDMEAFLWEQEAQRNEIMLSMRSILDKSSDGWLSVKRHKQRDQLSKCKARQRGGRDGSRSSQPSRAAWAREDGESAQAEELQ